MLTKKLYNFIYPLLIILLCIPIVLPYFSAGFFPTHDGEWAVVRLGDMFRSLRDLQFPVRYSGGLNFGYGYPLFNYAYPFPYYLGIIFYFLTHSFVASVKILFVLSVFLSGLFMYLASSKLWKNKTSGFISAVLYLYLPYRMVDLYVRGSLGESISFALFPLIFLFSIDLLEPKYKKMSVVLLSISAALLVGTHNIMTVLFFPVLVSFILVVAVIKKSFNPIKSFIFSLLLGLGLASFFWVPALLEKNLILLSKIPIADRNLYFVKISQLVIPSWGYSAPLDVSGFSYQLGIAQIIVIALAFLVIVYSIIKNKKPNHVSSLYTKILLVIFFVCFLLLFNFSSPVWKGLPLLKEINYPWTLLSQLGFLSSLIVGFLVSYNKVFRYLTFCIVLLAIVSVLPYAKPQEYVNRGDAFYLTNEATTTSSNELMPLWVGKIPENHFKNKVEIIKGDGSIKNIVYNSKRISFDTALDTSSFIRISAIYFPGWKAFVNKKETKIDYGNDRGLMEINLPKGKNSVSLIFSETPLRLFTDMLSILSLLVLVLYFFKFIQNEKN